MLSRFVILVIAAALLTAACGVSRDEAVAIDTPVSAGDGADAAPSDDGAPADGGDTDAPADDGTTPTAPPVTAPPSTGTIAPPTTAAADEVAVTIGFEDGSSVEILHGTLNDVVVPTRDNDEFVDLIYLGQVPPGFEADVLTQAVLGTILTNQLESIGAEPSAENLDEARSQLLLQLEPAFGATSPDPAADAARLYDEVPYLPFLADLVSRQIGLAEALAEASDIPGEPCVRHILVEQEDEAADVLAELEAGADFADLAAERSIGPTGPNGGDLGCAPAASYVAEFADAVTAAEVGEFAGPVQTQFGWHVLVVERFEVNGDQLAQEALTVGLQTSEVTVDERVGFWDPTLLTVVPAGS